MGPLSATASFLTVLGILASSTKAAQHAWAHPRKELSELNELASQLDLLSQNQAFQNKLHALQAPYQSYDQPKECLKSPFRGDTIQQGLLFPSGTGSGSYIVPASGR